MDDISCAVIVPAGPNDDTVDTLRSVRRYMESRYRIIVVDDTGGTLADVTDVDVIAAPSGAPGGQGGLWVKLAAGYRHALRVMDPDVVLRLDADALMIGPGLVPAAAARFAADPGVGMLGSYRVGTDGGRRDWSPAARILATETGPLGLRHPAARRTLRRLRDAAARTGYVPGEHPLGACYLHSGAAVRRIAELGLLDLPELAASGLGEDHIFGLVTMAAGFRIADFGGPADPLAVSWKGLPQHPAELVARGKLVTHSVRSYQGLTEPEIRAYFGSIRGGAT